jgi:hypothetical protein
MIEASGQRRDDAKVGTGLLDKVGVDSVDEGDKEAISTRGMLDEPIMLCTPVRCAIHA